MAAAGALLLAALAVVVHGRSATAFDLTVLHGLQAHIDGAGMQVSLDAGTPVIGIVALVVVFGSALATRNWRLAVLAVVPTAVASSLVEYVLKPLVDRTYDDNPAALAYPSGHENLVVCAALVIAVALGGSRLRSAVRTVWFAVLALWAVVAGVGLVVNLWHYATDVIGAVALSLACVLGCALLVDALAERRRTRLSSPDDRVRSRTAPAA